MTFVSKPTVRVPSFTTLRSSFSIRSTMIFSVLRSTLCPSTSSVTFVPPRISASASFLSSAIRAAAAFIFAPRFDFAKYSSSFIIQSIFRISCSANIPTCPDISFMMRSISASSSLLSMRISLFASTTLIGSMNRVAPVADVSCTSPLT